MDLDEAYRILEVMSIGDKEIKEAWEEIKKEINRLWELEEELEG